MITNDEETEVSEASIDIQEKMNSNDEETVVCEESIEIQEKMNSNDEERKVCEELVEIQEKMNINDDESEVCEESTKIEENSSDSDSSDEEDILEKRAKELESEISNNPYAYNAYVELVGIYKKLLNITDMRNAYERFYKYYPLTGQLWLDWIKDEIRVANTENEKNYIISLFDKAIEDYLSVDLWLEYVQFSIGFETDFTRKVFEKAVNDAGLHFMKGSLIWDAYREYELALLSGICDTENDAWKQQVLKVNDIFKRQLSVPLMEMEGTFIEWRVWVERLPKNDFIDREPVNWVYKNSTKYLTDYLEFEDKLTETEDESKKLEIYRDYIYDTRKPEYIRCLYERAIAEFSLNGELWLEYCMYYFKLDNYEVALKTCARALRNCYDAELWVFNIRILEIAGKSHDEITSCLEKALSYQLDGQTYCQIWLAYMDHYRRITDSGKPEEVEKIRDAFEKGHKYLVENFGFEVDPEFSFLRFWARIEASFLKDITATRKIWSEYGILKVLGSSANSWLELLNLEQQYGDDKHVRKTYNRALTSTKDWPQSIIQSWITYERQFGSAASVIICTETCRKFMKKWNKNHPVQAEDSYNGQSKELNNKTLRDKKRNFQNKRSSYDHYENRKKYEQKDSVQNDRKRKQPQRSSMEKEQKQIKISDTETESQQSNNDVNKQADNSNQKEYDKIDVGSEKQQQSVFISNLDYGVTEEQLKDFLGPVKELRLVKDAKGISRGYAYCVLNSVEEAQKTLKRDRELLSNRPVFISKCNVDKAKRKPVFNYPIARENNKLFVKGLPCSLTQEQVQALFEPHGEIKEVRLVTYKNGNFKGLAYVDFKDPKDAANAIIAIDNTNIEGFTISVAISDPPIRKNYNNFSFPTEVPKHAKSRLQMPLVPRVVQTQNLLTSQPSSSTPLPLMTNEDFRKMLNKK